MDYPLWRYKILHRYKIDGLIVTRGTLKTRSESKIFERTRYQRKRKSDVWLSRPEGVPDVLDPDPVTFYLDPGHIEMTIHIQFGMPGQIAFCDHRQLLAFTFVHPGFGFAEHLAALGFNLNKR